MVELNYSLCLMKFPLSWGGRRDDMMSIVIFAQPEMLTARHTDAIAFAIYDNVDNSTGKSIKFSPLISSVLLDV